MAATAHRRPKIARIFLPARIFLSTSIRPPVVMLGYCGIRRTSSLNPLLLHIDPSTLIHPLPAPEFLEALACLSSLVEVSETKSRSTFAPPPIS